jgi:hypothetical protein
MMKLRFWLLSWGCLLFSDCNRLLHTYKMFQASLDYSVAGAAAYGVFAARLLM